MVRRVQLENIGKLQQMLLRVGNNLLWTLLNV